LVKAGGILSGHDYLQGTVEEGYPANFGVKAAVDEFVAEQGLRLETTTEDGSPTWWVFKPNDAAPIVQDAPVAAGAAL
jgi:hypothetical protein